MRFGSIVQVSLFLRDLILPFPSVSVIPPWWVSPQPFFGGARQCFSPSLSSILILVWGASGSFGLSCTHTDVGLRYIYIFKARHCVKWPGETKWQVGCVMWQHLTQCVSLAISVGCDSRKAVHTKLECVGELPRDWEQAV